LGVGCGPGSITLGLAAAMTRTGSVLGVDFQPSQVRAARAAAEAAGAANLEFVVGSATALPIASASSIDVVFSHALFEHLPDPAATLIEIRRVLRPDSRLAVSSSDWSRATLTPSTEDIQQALAGHYLLRRRAGGDPFPGGRLTSLLHAHGFTDVSTARAPKN